MHVHIVNIIKKTLIRICLFKKCESRYIIIVDITIIKFFSVLSFFKANISNNKKILCLVQLYLKENLSLFLLYKTKLILNYEVF